MWRKRRPLDGLDDEIRAHIERETDDYISRGVAPEEAHRLAGSGQAAITAPPIR